MITNHYRNKMKAPLNNTFFVSYCGVGFAFVVELWCRYRYVFSAHHAKDEMAYSSRTESVSVTKMNGIPKFPW